MSPATPTFPFDRCKFEQIEQIGGIRTGSLDHPNPLGSQSCRVAHLDTGSGLRLTVALDRGGDLVEASYNNTNLAYLTPNGYKPSSPAYHRDMDWLQSWPGGLLTTCGPVHMGEPRDEDDQTVSLHGRHSNTPAAVLRIENPDPWEDKLAMSMHLTIRDTRMFGPNVEVRRQISSQLGSSEVHVADEVINLGDEPCPHALLYHVNLGYPLLDEGAQLVFQGPTECVSLIGPADNAEQLNRLKTIPAPDEAYAGFSECVLISEVPGDSSGNAHVGLINHQRKIAVELIYPIRAMPRLGNWQHFGPRGSYVTGLEPFSGTLLGKERDAHPQASLQLQPGERKRYALTIAIHSSAEAIKALESHDGPLFRTGEE